MEYLTTSDGRTLAYRVAGSGPALVCHPGGPGSSGQCFGDLAGLDRHLTLIGLDPRGAGGSDPPVDGSYRLEEYAADLDELRAHLGHERISLLGHSHGGFVAMVFAAEYAERVDRLILVGTLARFGPEQRAAKERALAALAENPDFAEAVAARRARDAAPAAEPRQPGDFARELPLYFARFGERERRFISELVADRFDFGALRFFNGEIAPSFDLRPRLAEISVPTLLVTGEADYMAGPACAEEIATGIHDARAAVIPAAGHFPWVEEPERFRSAILPFLDEPA